jgi:hypothetical protein
MIDMGIIMVNELEENGNSNSLFQEAVLHFPRETEYTQKETHDI